MSNSFPTVKVGLVALASIAFVSIVYLAEELPQTAASQTVAVSNCKSDWTKCADYGDMRDHYSGWETAKSRCKWETNDRAKYGSPEWSWLPFIYAADTDFRTGVVTLIDLDVKFQNVYGVRVRSNGVYCDYDLRTKKVLNVTVLGGRQ